MFIRNLAIVAMMIMGLTAVFTLAEDTPVQHQQQSQPQRSEDQAQDQVTGKVMNLYDYLNGDQKATQDKAAKSAPVSTNSDQATDRPLADGLPIAIVADRAVIADLVTGERAYLVLFDPDDAESQAAYEQLRSMIGQQVTLVGRKLERGDIQAIEVRDLDPAVESAKSPEDQSGDRS